MNATREFLFFFSCLGVFNGLLLSAYFLFFTKKKHPANYFLAGLLMMMCTRIGKSALLYFHHDLPKIYLQIGLSACFLIGPLLFYFASAATGRKAYQKTWKWTIGISLLIIVCIGTAFTYQEHPGLWGTFIKIIYAEWFIFLLASAFLLRSQLSRLFSRNLKSSLSEQWTCNIFLGNAVIFVLYFLALINVTFTSYILGAVMFTFVAYLAIFILMYRRRTEDLFAELPQRYSGRKLEEQEAGKLTSKIEKLMAGQKPYRDADLKLGGLASMLNIPAHQLSQLLNDNLGKSFTTYINEFRISEACQLIALRPNITLEQIGYEVGFNSKSTFFASFKKITGTTPAAYQLSQTDPQKLSAIL